jgi:small GTP-binding protein
MKHDHLIKLIIVGNSGSGKSCIISKFKSSNFSVSQQSFMTIGVEFVSKSIDIGGKKIKLNIWDTAGQEIFRSITRNYYNGVAIALLVYDVTNRKSFNDIKYWLDEIRISNSKDVIIVLVGNKIDIAHNRIISTSEGHKLSLKEKIPFYETSVKNNDNIDIIFMESCKLVMEKIKIMSQLPGVTSECDTLLKDCEDNGDLPNKNVYDCCVIS